VSESPLMMAGFVIHIHHNRVFAFISYQTVLSVAVLSRAGLRGTKQNTFEVG